MHPCEPLSELIIREFAALSLGDPRRKRRVLRIVTALARDPAASFPAVVEDDSQLEGLYRLLGNPHVGPESLLAPHVGETVERCMQEPVVLAVQDTTQVECKGEIERVGMGRLHGSKHEGFLAHVGLAVTPQGRALGVLGLETWTRTGPVRWSGGNALTADAGAESARWDRMASAIEEQLAGSIRVIHVMDREGDQYPLFAALSRRSSSFVIRLTHDRRLVDGLHIRETVAATPVIATFSIDIAKRGENRRPAKSLRRFPVRAARTALLSVRASKVELLRPEGLASISERSLCLNVIHAIEENPPTGEEPIEWLLITRESIESPTKVLTVLNYYRCRWLIEEYFKSLKTGCSLEKRQLESYFAYVRALALLAPIAWALLHLRDTARDAPSVPASAVLTRDQISVLRAYKPNCLPTKPTAHDALLAVAKIGGHIKNNGAPGWIVLGRGFEKLLYLEAGWLARGSPTTKRPRTSDR